MPRKKKGGETGARGYACVDCVRDETDGRFPQRTAHAQFERYKQAQGSAMIFAVQYPVVEMKFCARAASREEIGTRTTRLTCVHVELVLACVQLFFRLKQNISLFEGRRRLYTSKAYLRARTKPPARYTG